MWIYSNNVDGEFMLAGYYPNNSVFHILASPQPCMRFEIQPTQADLQNAAAVVAKNKTPPG